MMICFLDKRAKTKEQRQKIKDKRAKSYQAIADFLNFRNCDISMKADTILDAKSAEGRLYQTPFTPNICGRISKQGSRNKS